MVSQGSCKNSARAPAIGRRCGVLRAFPAGFLTVSWTGSDARPLPGRRALLTAHSGCERSRGLRPAPGFCGARIGGPWFHVDAVIRGDRVDEVQSDGQSRPGGGEQQGASDVSWKISRPMKAGAWTRRAHAAVRSCPRTKAGVSERSWVGGSVTRRMGGPCETRTHCYRGSWGRMRCGWLDRA